MVNTTVKAACGCKWKTAFNLPWMMAVSAAEAHTIQTGHTVTMQGEIRADKKFRNLPVAVKRTNGGKPDEANDVAVDPGSDVVRL